MKTVLYLVLLTALFSLSSCRKYDKNASTRIGFYCLGNSPAPVGENALQLFIDDVHQGNLNVSGTELTCGSKELFYFTMDGREHQVDLRTSDGKLLSAEYLQVDKNSCRNGTSRDKRKKVEGINGSSVRSTDDCTIYAFTLN
jgi:hypothetical protein